MNLNFVAVLLALGADAAFRVMNAARPPANYLFATFLPERNKTSYQAKSGTMTVRSTMAGLVGMDSPYPPTGIVEASTFVEQIAKIANRVELSEQAQRELQELMAVALVNGGNTNDLLQATVLNFLDKLITQSHLDTMEYLRGQALSTARSTGPSTRSTSRSTTVCRAATCSRTALATTRMPDRRRSSGRTCA